MLAHLVSIESEARSLISKLAAVSVWVLRFGMLVFLRAFGVVAALSVALPVSIAAEKDAISLLTSVSMKQSTDDVVVTLIGSKAPDFTSFTMSEPFRVVVDWAGSRIQGVTEEKRFDRGLIRKISTRQFDSEAEKISRVTIELSRETSYHVEADGKRVLVHFVPVPDPIPQKDPEPVRADEKAKEKAETVASIPEGPLTEPEVQVPATLPPMPVKKVVLAANDKPARAAPAPAAPTPAAPVPAAPMVAKVAPPPAAPAPAMPIPATQPAPAVAKAEPKTAPSPAQPVIAKAGTPAPKKDAPPAPTGKTDTNTSRLAAADTPPMRMTAPADAKATAPSKAADKTPGIKVAEGAKAAAPTKLAEKSKAEQAPSPSPAPVPAKTIEPAKSAPPPTKLAASDKTQKVEKVEKPAPVEKAAKTEKIADAQAAGASHERAPSVRGQAGQPARTEGTGSPGGQKPGDGPLQPVRLATFPGVSVDRKPMTDSDKPASEPSKVAMKAPPAAPADRGMSLPPTRLANAAQPRRTAPVENTWAPPSIPIKSSPAPKHLPVVRLASAQEDGKPLKPTATLPADPEEPSGGGERSVPSGGSSSGGSNADPNDFDPGPRVMKYIGFRQMADVSRVFVRCDGKAKFKQLKNGSAVVLELLNTSINVKNNSRPLDTTYFNSAVTKVQAVRSGENTRIEVNLREAVPFKITRMGTTIAIDFKRAG
jgi:hypothetical protein